MGYGISAVKQIAAQENVMKIKTNLGLLSSSLIDSNSKDQYQKLKIEGKSENEIALIEEKDEEMVVALT